MIFALGVVPAAQAGAAISLSHTSGQAGTSVTVTGTGFPKNTKGSVVAGTTTTVMRTNATGAFQIAVVIPAGASSVVVTAKVSSASAFSVFTVVAPTPALDVAASAPKGIRFGVGTNGGPAATMELDEVTAMAGEAPSLVLSYKDFNQAPPLAELDAVRARGADTLLTWEPWAWGNGVEQPAYSLDRIASGDFDNYLHQWGTALGKWGHPVYLRFGHEMNGDWYPWSEGVNGNGTGDYVAAYRHVHDVLASTGATNIRWVWNPNVPYWGSTPLTQLYPGPGYVDVVALDGYNWGTSQSWSTWQEPKDLFGAGLSQIRQLAPGKPIMIAETASSELGGSKAAWNTELFSYLSAQADVVALIWFHINKEADWRINSSESSTSAFKAALASRR
ncbi:glycosyl hydrolase [Arthrobacter sp. Bz4]|uniref:glycoside hydrolase family 26 protein n=1 Tax=Arthrobacter sp. Bz4 TaxID=2171979 RepID=UPI000D5163D6|nr:glycosyl hydrolase [Arthrobacter sp. Bz4]PVE19288.1 beta-mannanase [Arthrobacter sp. Bz4]